MSKGQHTASHEAHEDHTFIKNKTDHVLDWILFPCFTISKSTAS